MGFKILKESFTTLPSDKKKMTVLLFSLVIVVSLNAIGIYQRFYVVVPVTVFALIFSVSVAFLKNEKVKLYMPTWYRIVAGIFALYSGYFLVGALVLNAPNLEPQATNIYGGKVISTAGAINRSLTGYEYVGRVDYKRIYISEAINQFTGRSALGEIDTYRTGNQVIEQINQSKNDIILVFFKNNCPYCAGGFSGVLKKYSSLPENWKSEVIFVNLETEIGQVLSEEYQLEKASTLVRVKSGGEVSAKGSYATEDKNPNRDVIDMVFSPLYT